MLAQQTTPQWMDEAQAPVYMTLAGNVERRKHRRRDFEMQNIVVERWDAMRKQGTPLGMIIDVSPGGIRLKARHAGITPDTHIRLRLKLPTYAGISPFIDHDHDHQPKSDWVGWMVVTRVTGHGRRPPRL